ncbi:MAG: 4-hydroxy-tetrahydrodipicolinate reductase [Promicromonosporaceae bacterium]|nr:4-hydroxy-tetrahydrodipicolinate reductase [Promicromonosporaceae bacterium]
MIRVAVLGAAGRMGQATCAAVVGADGMELAARYDLGGDLAAVLRDADVAVDFTVPAVTEANVLACLEAGVPAVVGTTGWDEASLARVAARAGETGVLVVPNFSISAVLAMRFAQAAAPYFESAEVIELHHPGKVDAPSGTALHTAGMIARARGGRTSPDATEDGWEARGAEVDGVRVHSVRLPGLTAHQEVLLGNPGELLTIRQDSFDRVSFMPGVLLAIRALAAGRPGLTVGLDSLLDL